MKYLSQSNRKKYTKGFTLVEMLVSVGLFSIVMLVSVAAILSIIGNNRRAQGINNVVNNLNFAIESMVRDMKTGYSYQCGGYNWPIQKDNTYLCLNNGPKDTVAFFSTLSGTQTAVEYKFIPAATSTDGIYTGGRIVKRSAGGGYVDLTSSSDGDIQDMRMFINSPAPGSGSQPSIFLIIAGRANLLDSQATQFGIQTFISQRFLNL